MRGCGVFKSVWDCGDFVAYFRGGFGRLLV